MAIPNELFTTHGETGQIKKKVKIRVPLPRTFDTFNLQ